jgi:hypothetical protein
MDSSAKSFESAEIEQLVASSTSELAPQLNAARKQWPYHPLVLVDALTVLGIAIASGLQPLAIGALVFGGVAWPGIFVLDRKRRTTTLDYNLRDDQNQAFGELVRTLMDLPTALGSGAFRWKGISKTGNGTQALVLPSSANA